MKRTVCLIILFLFVSCAPQKELVLAPEVPPPVPEPLQTPQPAVTAPLVKYKSFLQCDEKTEDFFNSNGLEVLPFIRVVFFDIDGDGMNEMIAGSKDGSLRLYRNSGSRAAPHWIPEADYFKGVAAGAFSAPAAGDIDGDGKPEVLVGTGGFSKDSGRVICYKNSGTLKSPVWEKMDLPEIRVGNDATPALFDVDRDGRTDLIVGNSTGSLFLFRSKRQGNGIVFAKDTAYFNGVNLGMYVVPAVTSYKDRIVIVAGNSMGKLSILERGYESRSAWQRSRLSLSFSSFAAPAFIQSDRVGVFDLVISDGNGQLTYYRNRRNDYRDWEKTDDFFSGRTLTGPASAPVVTELNGRVYMAVGNINGEIRLFVDEPSSTGLSWTEKPGFFKGIKLSSFSRGLLTEWDGRILLITGQQDGIMRAFLNTGSLDKPSWSEKKQFFGGVPSIRHAAPAVFDIDNDGKWELIVGGSDGYVKGFRYELGQDGNPAWVKIEQDFAYAKVDGYASPSLVKGEGKTYLLVGRQDGKISVFTSNPKYWGTTVFYPDDYLEGVQVCNHSCPAAVERKGLIELTIGDYNGNLKHFGCRREQREIKEN